MEDFVPFKLAVKLEEKGFREDCIAYYHTDGELIYNNDQWRGGNYKSLLKSYNSMPKNPVGCEQIDAPTISQVLNWLRKKKKIHIQILANACGYIYIICDTPEKGASDIHDSDYFGPNEGGAWDEYEDCSIAGIEYVLDNLI